MLLSICPILFPFVFIILKFTLNRVWILKEIKHLNWGAVTSINEFKIGAVTCNRCWFIQTDPVSDVRHCRRPLGGSSRVQVRPVRKPVVRLVQTIRKHNEQTQTVLAHTVSRSNTTHHQEE